MKKILLTSTAILALSISTSFASPVNDLRDGQTAIGVQDKAVYVEHQFSDNLTLGLQKDDIYGHLKLNQNFRIMAGSKDYNSSSEFYAGVGFTTPLASNLDGYASYVAGSDFKEMQVGTNINVAPNLDLNVNYRSMMPDHGGNSDQTSIGASFKF